MRKRLSCIVALGIIVSLFSGVLTGCASSSKSSGSNQSGQATTSSKEVAKPDKITVIMDTILKAEDGRDQLIAEYKKQTGIDLTIIQPAHNQYYEKVNLAFASGDIPDALEISDQYMIKYGTQGGLVPLDNFVSNSPLLKDVDKKIVDAERVKGKLYGYPESIGQAPMTYIRKDWLDALNMKAPTNYDEFYKMLLAFKDQDPGKIGKNNVIPYTASGVTDPKFMREFWQDSYPGFTIKNGNYVDGFAQPEFKAALTRLNQAYKDGLIDKETVTNQTSTCRDKFNAGKVGVFDYWSGAWNVNLEDALKKGPAGKDASIVAIPSIKESKYFARTPATIAITSKAKNPEGVFKYFVEYMHDGDKGQMLFSHGVEGVHYKNEGGKIVHLPSLSDPKTILSKTFLPAEDQLTPYKTAGYAYDIDSRITNSVKIMNQNYVIDQMLPASNTLTKVNADLVALRGEVIAKAMMGDLTVDAALDKYNKEAKAMGVDNIVTELNQTK